MERTGSLKPSDKIARKQHIKVQTVMRPKCDNTTAHTFMPSGAKL